MIRKERGLIRRKEEESFVRLHVNQTKSAAAHVQLSLSPGESNSHLHIAVLFHDRQ